MKRLIRLFFAVFALFSLFLLPYRRGTEHTELVVDGEYKPFNVPENTMKHLMELIEKEDADTIYEVFSKKVRKDTDDLYEKIQELIRFLGEGVTSWKFSSGVGNTRSTYGRTNSSRASLYKIQKNSGTYRCDIYDVLESVSQKETIGFSSILIFPGELSHEYGPMRPLGIYIVYRVGDEPQNSLVEPSPLETLMQLAKEGNMDGIYETFSLAAKKNTDGLQENISELMNFLSEQVISWEPYTWTQNLETIDGAKVTTREMFFYLHTNHGLYRCDIRDVLETTDQEMGSGSSSISIFPALYPGEEPQYEDEIYDGYCTWGRENMGISIVYQQEN